MIYSVRLSVTVRYYVKTTVATVFTGG